MMKPIVYGSGCKHAINQKDRSTLMIVMVNAELTIYDLPMLLTYGHKIQFGPVPIHDLPQS
jgi:hypothetical protein